MKKVILSGGVLFMGLLIFGFLEKVLVYGYVELLVS